MKAENEVESTVFFPLILSVKHQFYLLFASKYFPSRSSFFHAFNKNVKNVVREKLLAFVRTAFVALTYIRIAIFCL